MTTNNAQTTADIRQRVKHVKAVIKPGVKEMTKKAEQVLKDTAK